MGCLIFEVLNIILWFHYLKNGPLATKFSEGVVNKCYLYIFLFGDRISATLAYFILISHPGVPNQENINSVFKRMWGYKNYLVVAESREFSLSSSSPANMILQSPPHWTHSPAESRLCGAETVPCSLFLAKSWFLLSILGTFCDKHSLVV